MSAGRGTRCPVACASANCEQIMRHVMEDTNSRKIFLFLVINVGVFRRPRAPPCHSVTAPLKSLRWRVAGCRRKVVWSPVPHRWP